MPRRKTDTYLWVAEVEIETISNLAFGAYTKERKLKSKRSKETLLDLNSFVNGDDIVFDSGKRLRGWLKQQIMTVTGKSSVLSKRAQHGLRTVSLPKFGMNPIGGVLELVGEEYPDKELTKINLILPEQIETYPFCEYGMSKTGHSFVSKYYLLPPPRVMKAKIVSFCKGLEPEFVETLMREIGQYSGLGDRHAQGSFGLFKLNKFELEKSEKIA